MEVPSVGADTLVNGAPSRLEGISSRDLLQRIAQPCQHCCRDYDIPRVTARLLTKDMRWIDVLSKVSIRPLIPHLPLRDIQLRLHWKDARVMLVRGCSKLRHRRLQPRHKGFCHAPSLLGPLPFLSCLTFVSSGFLLRAAARARVWFLSEVLTRKLSLSVPSSSSCIEHRIHVQRQPSAGFLRRGGSKQPRCQVLLHDAHVTESSLVMIQCFHKPKIASTCVMSSVRCCSFCVDDSTKGHDAQADVSAAWRTRRLLGCTARSI